MKWFSKKLNVPQLAPQPYEKPIVYRLEVINNATDKVYEYVSENDYGFNLTINDSGWLTIRQMDHQERDLWHVVARLWNMSITKMEWEKVIVNPALLDKKDGEDEK